MIELERAVTQLAEEGSAEVQGMFIYRLAEVHGEAYHLFRKHDLMSPHSEWPNSRQNLVELQPVGESVLHNRYGGYTIFKF